MNPLEPLRAIPFAAERVAVLIAKYPSFDTGNGGTGAGGNITDAMWAEIEPLLRTTWEQMKREVASGLPEKVREYETVYSQMVTPAPHHGHPGCQWNWETSRGGQTVKRASALAHVWNLFSSAKAAAERKKAEEMAAAERKKAEKVAAKKRFDDAWDKWKPIMLDALKSMRCAKPDHPDPYVRWHCVGPQKVWVAIYLDPKVRRALHAEVGQKDAEKFLGHLLKNLHPNILSKFWMAELARQEEARVEAEVKRQLAEDEFKAKVKARVEAVRAARAARAEAKAAEEKAADTEKRVRFANDELDDVLKEMDELLAKQ